MDPPIQMTRPNRAHDDDGSNIDPIDLFFHQIHTLDHQDVDVWCIFCYCKVT